MQPADITDLHARLTAQIARVVVGQSDAVRALLVALLSEGHVLLEGLPGTAKTLLAQTFSACLGLRFQRIQFTPDLMPGDVLGTNVFNFRTNEFVLTRGPVFTELLLADEINRTPPKTQAALLQAMQEHAVSIDGTTHDLGAGFMVVATQNPLEQEGTYPLPEAQLDRFLLKVPVDYPARDAERRLVRLHGHRGGQPRVADLGLEVLADLDRIVAARRTVAAVDLSDAVLDYAVDLVRATREHPALAAGASPRATAMLCVAARASALIEGRTYVVPDDVKRLALPVLGHRMTLAASAEIEGLRVASVLEGVLGRVAVPR